MHTNNLIEQLQTAGLCSHTELYTDFEIALCLIQQLCIRSKVIHKRSVQTQGEMAMTFACMLYLQIDDHLLRVWWLVVGETRREGGNATLMECAEDLDLKTHGKLLHLINMYVQFSVLVQ